jgi:hypothetical protein
MSLLPNDTYANAGRALWAVAGSGGGGGSGSTLQSPASVTPDVNGATSFSLTSTGTGSATIAVTTPTIATVAVNGVFQSIVTLGSGGSMIGLLAGSNGVLSIKQGSSDVTPAPVVTVDVVGNVIGLGQPAAGSISVNTPLTYSTTAGAPKAAFPAIVLSSTSGSFVQGDNSVALGGLAAGLYAMYGDSGASTNQNDLDCRFASIVQINPVGTCSGGAGGSDTGWNLSPNGTGGLTLNLTNAPTGAFSVKAYPIYLF